LSCSHIASREAALSDFQDLNRPAERRTFSLQAGLLFASGQGLILTSHNVIINF